MEDKKPAAVGMLTLESYSKQLVAPPGPEVADWWKGVDMPGRELLYRYHQPHNSFNRNFFNWLNSQMLGLAATDTPGFADGDLNYKDINGIVRGGIPMQIGGGETSVDIGYRGSSGSNRAGIIIGTGSIAFTFDDWGISGLSNGNIILDGTGAGEMNRVQSEVSTFAWDSPTRKWTTTYPRFFNNNSGGTITVAEVCMRIASGSGSDTLATMVFRDVLGTSIPVDDGGQLLVTYTLISAAFEGP